MRQLEIIAISLADGRQAQAGGATSLEIVREMAVGGLTPQLDIVRAIRDAVTIPIRVILRPHAQSFTYNEMELARLTETVEQLKAIGANGVVFGALLADGTVDLATSRRIAQTAAPLEFTFHRAIDVSRNAAVALPEIITFAQRVLTSGTAENVWDGRETIHRWVSQFGSKVTFACGGGLKVEDLTEVVRITNAPEYHFGSAARSNGVVDSQKVAAIRRLLESAEGQING